MGEGTADKLNEFAKESVVADVGDLAVGKFLVDAIMFPFRAVGRIFRPHSTLSDDPGYAARTEGGINVTGELRDLKNSRAAQKARENQPSNVTSEFNQLRDYRDNDNA